MAISRSNPEAVGIAVFAKAPRPGEAKTRLISVLGAVGAARLQRRLTLRALATAFRATVGPVDLWCAPDMSHRFFRALHREGLPTQNQCGTDLGDRMLAAFSANSGPLLLMGTDCPALGVCAAEASQGQRESQRSV